MKLRHKVENIRCDYAGENKALEREIIESGMKIFFGFTAVNTPQQNGRVKQKFARIYGQVRTMTVAGIEGELRKSLWAEAGNAAIHLINIQISHKNQTSPFEIFTRKQDLPKYAESLK